jgi:hypothetical protein
VVDKTECTGCRDDVYNHQDFGMNVDAATGEKSCWMRAEATMVTARDIPIDMRPPYLGLREKRRPNCWRGAGVVRVKATSLDAKGFWK